MRELSQGRVDHGLGGQLGDGKPSDGGRALAVVVEDSVEGHGVESEERSVLHVVHPDGRHAAGKFCSYDGTEAERLIGGYEKVGRGRKERGEKKGKGELWARREEEGEVRWESTRDSFYIPLPQR